MEFSPELTRFAILALIAAAVGGIAFAILFPYFSGSAQTSKRVVALSSRKTAEKKTWRERLGEDSKEGRTKQIMDSLKQVEEQAKIRKKRLTLKMSIKQAGLSLSVKGFWMLSAALGAGLALATTIVGVPVFVIAGAAIAGGLGLPRWILKFLRNRRQNIFLNDFADGIDIMVRGLKAGLPVTDAMKVIATETGPPVGPEFLEIVEGQRVGITVDQGVARMFDRMPLPEVNFLGIVMAIQRQTGGNLSESLANLSKVLRDRKKMKGKIKAISQEAKASAMIIGSLPFGIMGALLILNPAYLNPLFESPVGHMLLAGSAGWMSIGILIMRKMINFDF